MFVLHEPALRLKLIVPDSDWNTQTEAPGSSELGLGFLLARELGGRRTAMVGRGY